MRLFGAQASQGLTREFLEFEPASSIKEENLVCLTEGLVPGLCARVVAVVKRVHAALLNKGLVFCYATHALTPSDTQAVSSNGQEMTHPRLVSWSSSRAKSHVACVGFMHPTTGSRERR